MNSKLNELTETTTKSFDKIFTKMLEVNFSSLDTSQTCHQSTVCSMCVPSTLAVIALNFES